MIASPTSQLQLCTGKSIFSQTSAAGDLTAEPIPSAQAIADCYRFFDASDKIIRHCAKVAQIAIRLGKAAIDHDYAVQLDMLTIAAQLHDAARKHDHHEIAVATYLHQHGYHAIADIIMQHMSARPEFLVINEAALLFLADKLAKEDCEVTIAERYACAQQKYSDNPKILQQINYNIKMAETIYKKIQK